MIHDLVANGAVVSDHATIGKDNFDRCNMLLGTGEGCEFSLNLELLGLRSEDLASLDDPINKEVLGGGLLADVGVGVRAGQIHG